MTPLLVVMDKMYGRGRGGTERQVQRLLPALRRAGITASVLFLRHDPWHAEAGFDFEWRELAIERLLPLGLLQAAIAVRSEARRIRARVVMSFFDDAMAVASLASILTPELRFIATQRNMGTERGALKQVGVGWFLRRADKIIVNSMPVKHQILERYGNFDDRVCVIDNMPAVRALVDSGPAGSVRAAVEECRRQSLAVAVIVANLRPVKGVQDVIEALAMEPARSASVGLVILGDGPSRDELEAQALARGVSDRVRFVGHVADVSTCLPLFDFAVLPSHAEGSANAGLEFASASLAFVATKVGGNASLLDESGAGLPVPSREPGALSRAIAELAMNPDKRRQLGARGKAFSAQRPTEADVVASYETLIKGVAARIGDS